LKPLSQILPRSSVLSPYPTVDPAIENITNDLSEVGSRSLFFAIRGNRHDGHADVALALQRGAIVVVEEGPGPKSLLVSNTRRAWGESLSYWNEVPSRSLRLVGFTGTNGKTTCTYLLEQAWRALGKSTGLVGTVEYRVGKESFPAPLTTPDAVTLQSLFAKMRGVGVERVAMEVSSIALDQRRVAGSVFKTGVFTNFTPDHLDYHGTMETYFKAKRLFFTELNPEFAILNQDDVKVAALRSELGSKCLSFSLQTHGADFTVQKRRFSPLGTEAEIQTPEGRVEFKSPLLGEHNLSNCLAVLAALMADGVGLRDAAHALGKAVGAPGRLERVACGEGRAHAFVDYAHTEDALVNVLKCLRTVREGTGARILTVFGCGGDRDRSKRPKMALAACRYSDLVVATSDNPRTEDPEKILDEVVQGFPPGFSYHRESDRKKAIYWALSQARVGDFVLIAGKGHENYQILGQTKVPFDDRIVIREYYGEEA
jgi:UDP-N-acetylmuramoyl-L-alanyl-D-glutamate--2,6-diaminopimelate ligase